MGCTPFCASLSAFSGQFDTHFVRSIFSDVHAAGENLFDLFFAVRGEKLCEAFSNL